MRRKLLGLLIMIIGLFLILDELALIFPFWPFPPSGWLMGDLSPYISYRTLSSLDAWHPSHNWRSYLMQILVTWELLAATVILIVSLVIVFMLLRFAAIMKTLEDTQRILRVQQVLLDKLLSRADPRLLLEMDLPLNDSAAVGGVIKN